MQIWTRVDVEVQTETWVTRLVADVHGNALATLSVGLSSLCVDGVIVSTRPV